MANDDEDEIQSIPGSPVPPSIGTRRQFSRLLYSPDAEEEEEQEEPEPIEERPTSNQQVKATVRGKAPVVPSRGQVEVVISRSASASKAAPNHPRSTAPVDKAPSAPAPFVLPAAPASASTSNTPAPSNKRKRSPDPLAPSPIRPKHTPVRAAAASASVIALPASATSVASTSTTLPASTAQSSASARRASNATPAPGGRASSRQAAQKEKEEAEKEEKRRKRAERKAREAEEARKKDAKDEALRNELQGGEVVRKQPSKAERSAASIRSSDRQLAQVTNTAARSSRQSAKPRQDAQTPTRAGRRGRSVSKDVLEESPVTELEQSPAPDDAGAHGRSRRSRDLIQSDPAEELIEPPAVKTYSRRQGSRPKPGAVIDIADDEDENDAPGSDDEVVEITPSPKRTDSTQSNKRRKTGHPTSEGKGSVRGKGAKRILSDTEDEDAEHIAPKKRAPPDQSKDVGSGRGGAKKASARGTQAASKAKNLSARKGRKVVPEESAGETGDEEEENAQADGLRAEQVEGTAAEQEDADADASKPAAPPKSPSPGQKTAEDDKPSSPTKRSPLQALPTGANANMASASPAAGPSRPPTTAPGGVKWRTRTSFTTLSRLKPWVVHS